jgi:cytochrome c oxidase cbb3-type subunit 1
MVFFGTIAKRKVSQAYLRRQLVLWFFHPGGGTCCTWSIVPQMFRSPCTRSPIPRTQACSDAMVQWWYGHNAVGFFLTAGFLGMMYYFVPKQAGRPVYSYRLSVVHFWALIFTYMWAGPHHLHYTALPDWTQSARHGVLADPAGSLAGVA